MEAPGPAADQVASLQSRGFAQNIPHPPPPPLSPSPSSSSPWRYRCDKAGHKHSSQTGITGWIPAGGGSTPTWSRGEPRRLRPLPALPQPGSDARISLRASPLAFGIFERECSPAIASAEQRGGVEGQLPAGLAGKGWHQHWMVRALPSPPIPLLQRSGSGRGAATLFILISHSVHPQSSRAAPKAQTPIFGVQEEVSALLPGLSSTPCPAAHPQTPSPHLPSPTEQFLGAIPSLNPIT